MSMYLDLGLIEDVQTDGEEEIRVKKPLISSFTTTIEATSEAGRLLDANRCISLLFLLLPDSANAKSLKICNQVSPLDTHMYPGSLTIWLGIAHIEGKI